MGEPAKAGENTLFVRLHLGCGCEVQKVAPTAGAKALARWRHPIGALREERDDAAACWSRTKVDVAHGHVTPGRARDEHGARLAVDAHVTHTFAARGEPRDLDLESLVLVHFAHANSA
jgi:hypothetical protein